MKFVAKILKKVGKFCSQKLYGNQLKTWAFIPSQKSASLQSEKGKVALPVNRLVDWPTVIFITVDRSVDRAKANGRLPDRPAPTREWGAFSRSTAQLTGRIGWPLCTSRAHRSTVTVDRLLVRSTVRSTASAVWLGIWVLKTCLFNFN